jgi:hypothetical protein
MKILDIENVVLIIDGLDELLGPSSHEQMKYLDTLNAVSQLIHRSTRLIISCRSTTFEAIGNTVGETLGSREQSSDATDKAIRVALRGKGNFEIEQIRLIDLTREQACTYLLKTVGKDSFQNPATAYVLDHLPRVPVILRFLQLALPELQGISGKINLDELYSVALRAWLIRDPAFVDQDVDTIWEKLRNNPSAFYSGSALISDNKLHNRLVHAGLLLKTSGDQYIWAHFSIAEFFFANSLFSQIKSFNSATLARLDLIGAYNINRFVVPMCRRQLVVSKCVESVHPVTVAQYNIFLKETGWRQMSGYGVHPSYVADDGTGFISGIKDLKPEPHAQPTTKYLRMPICGISWYDAFAYCIWSGESLPDSTQFPYNSSLSLGLWYWCIDWNDERKAHISVAMYEPDSVRRLRGGINPDFRHSRIVLATIKCA